MIPAPAAAAEVSVPDIYTDRKHERCVQYNPETTTFDSFFTFRLTETGHLQP